MIILYRFIAVFWVLLVFSEFVYPSFYMILKSKSATSFREYKRHVHLLRGKDYISQCFPSRGRHVGSVLFFVTFARFDQSDVSSTCWSKRRISFTILGI